MIQNKRGKGLSPCQVQIGHRSIFTEKSGEALAEQFTRWYILILFAVYPLFTGIKGYLQIPTGKYWFFLILTVLWAAATGIALLRDRKSLADLRKRLNATHGLALAFLGISLVSALLSFRKRIAFLGNDGEGGWVLYLLYVLVFFGVSMLGRPDKSWIKALTIPAVINCVVVILQIGNLNPLWLFPENVRYSSRNRLYQGTYLGTMGNVDIFAAFLSFLLPLFVVYALRSRKQKDRLFLLPAAATLITLVLTDTRMGYVGLIGCFLACLVVLQKDRKSAAKAGVVCAALACIGLVAIYFCPVKSGTLYQASQILHGNFDPDYGTGRILIWKESINLFVERPLLGGGPNSTAWRYTTAFWDEDMGQTFLIDNPHCALLGYLVNIGVLGTIPLVGLVLFALVQWRKNRKDPVVAAIGASVVCYLIQDFFNLNTCFTAPFLWAGLGALCQAHYKPKKRKR